MATGRDAKGRFVKGHRLSVGNKGGRPSRAVEENYLRILLKVMDEAGWEKVCRTWLSYAQAGDMQAIRELSNRLLGKPVERKEHDIVGQIIVGWDDGEDLETEDSV